MAAAFVLRRFVSGPVTVDGPHWFSCCFVEKHMVRAKQSFGRASHSWFLAEGTGLGNETARCFFVLVLDGVGKQATCSNCELPEDNHSWSTLQDNRFGSV